MVGFEQHMKEEDDVRIGWQSGKHEMDQMVCECCGDKNALDKTHFLCEEQCKRVFHALRAFLFAAWDDISGAKLDPTEVVVAMK